MEVAPHIGSGHKLDSWKGWFFLRAVISPTGGEDTTVGFAPPHPGSQRHTAWLGWLCRPAGLTVKGRVA